MKLKWMKSIPYTIIKGTKFDGVEPKYRETPAKKEDFLISRYVSSLQYRDSVIQLTERKIMASHRQ